VSTVVVGVSDCKLSNDASEVLATYALGSCIAVAVHDPVAGVGGLLHFMLPDSTIDRAKAQQNPWMFADTGMALLFRQALLMGANKRRLKVWAAGGAQMVDDKGVFEIGKRNCLALRKLLWKAGLLLHAEAVGGAVHRTVRLEVGAGRFWLRAGAGGERLLTAGEKESRHGI
jgi:chemotaxis protein CheD